MFSQAELCGQILQALDRLGVRKITPEQGSVVIRAANEIMAALTPVDVEAMQDDEDYDDEGETA